MRTFTNAIALLVAAAPVAGILLLLQWTLRPERLDELEAQPLDYTVDLNTADASTLQLLPGVGAGLADAIIDHRERLGGFDTIGQLEDVPRIGELTRERIEPWVRLGDAQPR